MSDKDEKRELQLIILDDIIGSIRTNRKRALMALIFILVAAVVWQVIAPAPGEAPMLERLHRVITIGGFSVFSVIYLGMTAWLGKLSREREHVAVGADRG